MDNDVEELFDQGLNRFNIDLYAEAIEIFTHVLQKSPDHPDALYYRALAWFHQGNLDQSIADFTQAIEKDPQAADCFIGRGEVWLTKGIIKAALGDFKKALDIEPGNPDYRKLVKDLEDRSGPKTGQE